MLQEQIKTLENVIDKEIDGYKNIEKLYVDKKEILVKGKSTELLDVDSKIVDTYKSINSYSEMRKNISKALNMPTFSLTDIINNIKEQDAQAAQNLEKKRDEVKELSHRIFELEKINMELLKHGMHVTNKTLEIILRGLKPITEEYNKNGKNITKDQLEMSSIIEEA